MTDIRQTVRLLAEDLAPGESEYNDCPSCMRPGKFSVTRVHKGILYHCFRDSCSMRGFLASHGLHSKFNKSKSSKVFEPKPYTKAINSLVRFDYARFWFQWGLYPTDLERGGVMFSIEEQGYLFPVMSPQGYRRGHLLRFYNEREPKALTFREHPGPFQSWYVRDDDFNRVLVVEDMVSAIKASRHITTVALLGTSISLEGAQEIAALADKEVILALDKDATATAFRQKRSFGLMFNHCRVLPLLHDIKDTSDHDIQELLK